MSPQIELTDKDSTCINPNGPNPYVHYHTLLFHRIFNKRQSARVLGHQGVLCSLCFFFLFLEERGKEEDRNANMVADKSKKLKAAEKGENVDELDGELVVSIEKLQEIQEELEKVQFAIADCPLFFLFIQFA